MLPTIMCAVCGKPVDRAEQCENPERQSFRFRAWCHGEETECELGMIDLIDGKLVAATAFNTPLLPAH